MEHMTSRAIALRERLFAGNQFIVVNASKEQPIELMLTRRGEKDAKLQTFTGPAAISRHLYSVESVLPLSTLWGDASPRDSREGALPPRWPALSLSTLQQAAAITDRRIYRPKDVVRLFAVGLMTPGATAQVSLTRAGQLVLTNEATLNDAGLALTMLEDLDEGEYQATVEVAGAWQAECTFTVAAYSLSLLTAVLEAHTYVDRRLSFDITLHQMDALYHGELQLGLQCAFCGDQIVETKQATAQEGKVSAFFDVGGHTGPFHVHVTTPGGEAAMVSFPSTRADVREAIPLNTLGRQVRGGLLPTADARTARGLFITTEGATTTPFIVESILARRGELRALADAGPLRLVTINPLTAEVSEREIASVVKGQALAVDVSAPYVLYTIGGVCAGKPFEAWGVFIRPEEIKPSLDAPKRVAPGAEITVRIETTRPAHCLLLVYDARLEHESPVPKLAERLFRHLREGTTGLNTGYIEPFGQTLRPPRREPPEDRLFALARASSLRPMRAAAMMAVPSPAMVTSALGGRLSAEAQPELQAETAGGRTEFPEMACVDFFPLEGASERTVTLGQQIGTWRCRAYVFRGLDYGEATADVETSKELYVELDLPAFISPGDEVFARARYHAPAEADFSLQTATGRATQRVQGDGAVELKLTGPGEVVGTISAGLDTDVISRTVGLPGRQKVTLSRLAILKAGESVEGERVVVYPNMGTVIRETIDSLIQYPYGCAEQTASKLYGLAIAYRGIERGFAPGDRARVQALIMTGLQRLQTFAHDDGRFSLWQGGAPDDHVTAIVARRLVALRGFAYELADVLLKKSGEALAKAGVRDNQLLPLGDRFRAALQSAQDAAALYFFSSDTKVKAESLDFLKKTAVVSDAGAHWPAADAWGGKLETTCDATRVLYAAGDALYRRGFAYVGGQLVDGRLYSTADTRALVELLSTMTARGRRVRLDGAERSAEAPLIGRRVVALEGDVVVRVDSEQEINYLEPSAGFMFDLTLGKSTLALGERTQVHITPREQSLCPLVRLYLPANLALLKGGANAQEAHLPVIGGGLTLDVVAVRRGKARLYTTLHDMYDAQKVGTAAGVEVTVG